MPSLAQLQPIPRRAKPLLAAPVILLGGGDTGVAHGVPDRDQILPVVQHRGGKGSPQVMRGTFLNPGLALAHVEDMVYRLVGQPVGGEGVKAADTRKQRPGRLAPDLVHPVLQPLPAAGREVGQPLPVPLAQHPQGLPGGDNVTQIEAHGLGAAQAAAEDHGQHRRIPGAEAGAVRVTHRKQGPDVSRGQGPATGQPAAAEIFHGADMLKALHVHEAQHPGFLRHPLECGEVGVDGGGGPAGVTQQLRDSHDVMPAQAAPAAGLRPGGAEQPGDHAQKGGHGLPAAGRVQGQKVGPGRIEGGLPGGGYRPQRTGRVLRDQVRNAVGKIICHPAHAAVSCAGLPPARWVKNRAPWPCNSLPQRVYFFKYTF